MKLDDFRNLDLQNLGNAPWPVKALVIAVVCAGIFYASWHFDIQSQRTRLEQIVQKESDLKRTFETKQRKAANLDALKQQMAEMEQSFGDMLRQLPNQTEVAGLLVDISQTGLAAGLEFELFKPNEEIPSDFYAELPIQIRVVGNYHQLGEFVSGVASLPRIVTTHNVTITRPENGSGRLTMDAVAKTYRALEEGENRNDTPKAKQQRRR